jgi:hypothetical protein
LPFHWNLGRVKLFFWNRRSKSSAKSRDFTKWTFFGKAERSVSKPSNPRSNPVAFFRDHPSRNPANQRRESRVFDHVDSGSPFSFSGWEIDYAKGPQYWTAQLSRCTFVQKSSLRIWKSEKWSLSFNILFPAEHHDLHFWQRRLQECRSYVGPMFEQISNFLSWVLHDDMRMTSLMNFGHWIADKQNLHIDRVMKRPKEGLVCWFCQFILIVIQQLIEWGVILSIHSLIFEWESVCHEVHSSATIDVRSSSLSFREQAQNLKTRHLLR